MTIKVPLIDILYLESVNRTVYLYTMREKFALHGYKFVDLVEQFISKGFVDIHRTCIVNCKYIFSVDDIEVRLDNGTSLGMSRRKRQQVLNKFMESINVGDDHD
jgi:DNA-binding LytR/AlgR family response regulator